MKTCPVCKTQVFADMEVCYGCMHRFAEPEQRTLKPTAGEGRKRRGAGAAAASADPADSASATSAAPAPAAEAAPAETAVIALPTAIAAEASSEEAEWEHAAAVGDGGWTVRFEMKDPRVPGRQWTMLLSPSIESDASLRTAALAV